MNQRTLEVLEYPRIRDTVAGFCMSEEGRSALLLREPSSDSGVIARLKNLSRAWMRALSSESPPALKGWPPVRGYLPRLQVEGASFALDELYALALFCDAAERLRAWAESRERAVQSGKRDSLAIASDPSDVALVAEALRLPDLSPVSSEIGRVIDKSGELRDLPELREIRQGIRKIKQAIDDLIGRYLSDDSLRTALQSTLPTIRDGRQVIALRANFKGRVRGIVHEVSQSGQTVYVEPEDVVDRNNDLVTEEHRLSREVARILREVTARISPYHGLLVAALDSMVFLDGIGAGARWGREHRCAFATETPPDNVQTSSLQLRQGRHPLLGSRAVPIDLVLTPGGRMLIITGPNTGGKTVSLKTVALFALLNQSGWPIPAADPSVFPVFDFIGCDIGDEQSLDQSLSTFSGHMKNIAGILSSATARSLVLLDELGSGTDPQEGSAIAMAVLDELLERGATVLVTTHHGILKNYGYTHAPCINASVDFDENTLSPTYRILMGVPGESHALDIAARNGLDPAIVAGARSYLKEERADVSALIKGLTAKHEELAQFEEDKKREERELREKRRKTDLKELQLRQKELELREQGYRRLDKLLSESRSSLENLVREIREGELTREKTLQVKAWIAEFGERVAAEQSGLAEERDSTGELVREIGDRHRAEEAEEAARAVGTEKGQKKEKGPRAAARQANAPQKAEYIPEFAPGVEVYMGPSKRRGTLVREDKKGQWIVSVGTLKLTARASELSAVPVNGQKKMVSVEVHTDMGSDDVPAFELRLIGMRHDEAMKSLERQLDLASMKGLKEFTIVHGKGQGILQTAVHDMLARYAGVGEYHFARPEDGGTGKTIVTMK
jgi:DNA mismatch repair protein MutS2